MATGRRRRGRDDRDRGWESLPPREFDLKNRAAQAQLPAALALLDKLVSWGGGLARVTIATGVPIALGGLALVVFASSKQKPAGVIIFCVGAAFAFQGAVVRWGTRAIRRALVTPPLPIRGGLIAILIGGAPFLVLGLILAAFMLMALGDPDPGVKLKGYLVMGVAILGGVGVPAMAAYGLLRHAAVWRAMDAEV